MVHQHFMLIPVMTVAENIVLGIEPSKDLIILDERGAEERVREISQQFGLAVDPTALISEITVGQQQRVEILKALYRGAEILILDEPTAVLTPQEATELFAIVKSLQADGKSIIFISHKLNEVLEIGDRTTVLRRGKQVGRCRAPARPSSRSPRRWSGGRCSCASRRRPRSRARRCSRSRTCTSSTTAGSRRSRGSRSTCTPARSSASRAWTATARPS